MIQGGIISSGSQGPQGPAGATGPQGPAGSSATLVATEASSLPISITGAGNQTLASVTVTVTPGQRVKITLFLLSKIASGSTPAGLHMHLFESGSQIWPVSSGLSTAMMYSVGTSDEPEPFTAVFVLSPSAGSHTYSFVTSAALQINTYTIEDAWILAEVYN